MYIPFVRQTMQRKTKSRKEWFSLRLEIVCCRAQFTDKTESEIAL